MSRQVAEIEELLSGEYADVAERVNQLDRALAAATRERNAILAAMSEAGLTQVQIADATGLTVARIRTAVWNAYRDRRAGHAP